MSNLLKCAIPRGQELVIFWYVSTKQQQIKKQVVHLNKLKILVSCWKKRSDKILSIFILSVWVSLATYKILSCSCESPGVVRQILSGYWRWSNSFLFLTFTYWCVSLCVSHSPPPPSRYLPLSSSPFLSLPPCFLFSLSPSLPLFPPSLSLFYSLSLPLKLTLLLPLLSFPSSLFQFYSLSLSPPPALSLPPSLRVSLFVSVSLSHPLSLPSVSSSLSPSHLCLSLSISFPSSLAPLFLSLFSPSLFPSLYLPPLSLSPSHLSMYAFDVVCCVVVAGVLSLCQNAYL